MARRKIFLHKLLETIVNEWGSAEVEAALSRVILPRGSDEQRDISSAISGKASPRQSAIAQVERAELREEQREPLLMLADRFDRKVFLPSVADVREFIIMTGERPVAMKDRTDAFRVLLEKLARLPSDHLQRIAQAASHSGPAQLGPISDAISAAGDRLPRRTQAVDAG